MTLFELTSNHYVYQFSEPASTTQTSKTPQRKRIVHSETFLPGLSHYLFSILIGLLPDLSKTEDSDVPESPKRSVLDLARIFTAHQSVDSDYPYDLSSTDSLRSIATNARLTPFLDDEQKPSIRFEFLTKNEDEVDTIAYFDYDQSADALSVVTDLIDYIEHYCKTAISTFKGQLRLARHPVRRAENNPLYDALVMSYYLRLVSNTTESMPAWVIQLLSLKQNISIENVVGTLSSGAVLESRILDAYRSPDREVAFGLKRTVKRTDPNDEKKTVETEIDLVRVKLFGYTGVGFTHEPQLRVFPKRKMQVMSDVDVDMNVEFKE